MALLTEQEIERLRAGGHSQRRHRGPGRKQLALSSAAALVDWARFEAWLTKTDAKPDQEPIRLTAAPWRQGVHWADLDEAERYLFFNHVAGLGGPNANLQSSLGKGVSGLAMEYI